MAASSESRQLEAIFIATPPRTPLFAAAASLTRTTTPRELPSMYHFDFATMECDGIEEDHAQAHADDDVLAPPPGPITTCTDLPAEYSDAQVELSPCPNCSRSFNIKSLARHINTCNKITKKRKPFDSSRQRREGTSLSTYVLPKNFGLPNAEKAVGVHTPPAASREASSVSNGSQEVASPLPDRRKSQGSSDKIRSTAKTSLRKAAAAATPDNSQAAPQQQPTAVSAPAPAPLARDRLRASRKEPASERCPHCERSFNLKAFDRHVEWCKEKAIQANIKTTNTQETNKAKERMEARKQYRPPNLKTKRSINRDKYSGSQEEQCETEMVSPKQNLMSLSMTSSVHSDNLHRNAPVKMPRPGTPSPKSNPTTITQNTVSVRMSAEDSIVANPERERHLNPRRKERESCKDIDAAVERLRRTATSESLQMAKLDCTAAAPLKPAKSRLAISNRPKVQAPECLAGQPQVTMTFEDLNGLIKRKGAANICNIKMDIAEQAIKMHPKMDTTTSLVRKARRRIRTRENPNIEARALESPQKPTSPNDEPRALPAAETTKEVMYFGSEDEDSERDEIQIKLERSTIKTVCRPKKKSQLPIIMSSPEPKKLLLPAAEMRMKFLPRIDHDKELKEHYQEELDEQELNCGAALDEEEPEVYDEADIEVGKLLTKPKLLECDYNHYMENDVMYSEDEQEEPQQRLSPSRKSPTSVSRRLVLLEQDEEGTMYIKAPPSPTKRRSPTVSECQLMDSGFSPLAGDKYDPFLSAKRQLEELCSPNTPPENEPMVQPTMSTSLTGTLGKLHNNTTTTTTPKTTTSSNFRRTSSLRGPRRTPLLPSRPLFATNYRPTIQRGLSDEGPISNNFLKPEEYDEMPVRAACVNDFHSPRVVRRDTSASNRKQQMKLPLSNATEQPNRNVAKTDSLAVFLKYEHELEQLNTKAAELAAANSKELSSKELKEKSNNLSKQNSAKNLTANSGQLPSLMTTPLCPPPTQQVAAAAKENNENLAHNYATPLRLEPITSSKPMTPLAPIGATMPIKLESIFSTYIDPKLINACDNLHVQQQQQSSTGSSDASSTPQQMPQSRSSSQSTITMGPEQRRHSGEARNLLKRKMRLGRNQFLYDASPEEAYISSGSCADDEGNRSSLEFDEQCWQQQQKQLFNNPILGMPKMPVLPTFDDFDFEEFLSSFENENDEEQFPLFRDCREFLLNRTSNRQRSSQKATSTPQPVHTKTETATQRPATAGSNFITPPKTTHFLTKASPTTHRSDSNASSSGGSFKTPANSSGSYKTAQNTTPLNSSDDNKSNHSSQMQKCEDESQKREIFISIETEANAQGRSPISPDSLRHMVGNAQTPIDVVHIDNGNEPEHAKFSKISDNEDQLDVEHDDELSRGRYTTKRLSSMPGTVPTTTSTSQSPNVEANNAKNVIEKFRNDFQQLGEQTGASVRLEMQQMQQKQAQQELKVNSPLTPSPSGDSDELSSLDGYPMSRRGASSKLSSDSAYGSSNSPYSLSRQRSSELQTDNSPRTQSQLRPHTASGALAPVSGKMDVSTQAQTNHGTLKARQRMFAGNGLGGNTINDVHAEYSSSSSEHLAQQQQQQNTNYNYQQQQQQQSKVQVAYNNNNNNNYDDNAKNLSNNKNNNDNSVRCSLTPTTSQQSLVSNNSNGSTSGMSASMKMSKFCHECGGKFVIEHAKFCMECGVRRVVL